MIDLTLIHLPLPGIIKIPTGLLSIADWLTKRGASVRVYDMRLYSERVNALAMDELLPRSRYVGVSVMTAQVPIFLDWWARYYRQIEGRLIVGGIHPTLFPEQMRPHADWVCDKGGEQFVGELLGFQCENGHAWAVDRGGPRDYSLVDIRAYVRLGETIWHTLRGPGTATVETARGCNQGCAFCISTVLPWGRPWRARPVVNVIEEIVRLHEECGVWRVGFEDEHFFGDLTRVRWLIHGLREQIPDLQWGALACVRDIVRANAIGIPSDPVRIGWLKDHGLVALAIGLESGSDTCLRRLRKPQTVEEIKACVEILGDADVFTVYSFINQIPGEPPETDQATYELMQWVAERHRNSRFSPPGQAQTYRPFPGTALAKEYGAVFPQSLYEWVYTYRLGCLAGMNY